MNEDIDTKLQRIGKDRAWLAKNTPYSPDYIRTVLAPNSKRRTERVMKVLIDAIETEERDREATPALPLDFLQDRLIIEPTRQEYEAWNKAAMHDKLLLKDWAIDSLNEAAEEWKQLKVAEEPKKYKVDQSKKA